MRSEYLLLSLLAPINSFARRGRDPDYIPSPPLVSEEDAEATIRSFDLSSRDVQAVFGDTGKLSLPSLEDEKLTYSCYKTTKSHRLPFLNSQAA